MDGNDVMVSVIVLTYNHEKYIRQALDSILMQKVDFKYEILVGDDASTDGTPEILREYAQRYPRVIRLTLRQKNVGGSVNAYGILRTAKGRYLATCEGDDYWCDEEKLQRQVTYLEEHPQLLGCVHPCVIVDENGRSRRRQKLEWVREKPLFRLEDFQGIYLPGQFATFVRRNIFLDPKYEPDVFFKVHPMVADRSSIVLYLLHGDIARIDRAMSCYRKATGKNAENLTSVCFTKNRNRIPEEYRILKWTEEYLQVYAGRSMRFEQRRKMLFAEGIFQWVRNRDVENFVIARKILEESENRLPYYMFVPIYGVRKVFKKIGDILLKD